MYLKKYLENNDLYIEEFDFESYLTNNDKELDLKEILESCDLIYYYLNSNEPTLLNLLEKYSDKLIIKIFDYEGIKLFEDVSQYESFNLVCESNLEMLDQVFDENICNIQIELLSKPGNVYKVYPIELTDKFINIKCEQDSFYINSQTMIAYFVKKELVNCFGCLGKIGFLITPTTKYDVSFSDEKLISKTQLESEANQNIFSEVVSIDDIDVNVRYGVYGKEENPKRIIFSFPGVMALNDLPFRIHQLYSSRKKDDLVIGFSDSYSNFGTYMAVDDFGNDITEHVKFVIASYLTKYPNAEVNFVGISKGGTIAAYYSNFFEVENLVLFSPQVDMERYFNSVTSERRFYLNVKQMFKVAEFDYTKLNISLLKANYVKYLYSEVDFSSDSGRGANNNYDELIIDSLEHTIVAKNNMTQILKNGNEVNIYVENIEVTYFKEFGLELDLSFKLNKRSMKNFGKELNTYVLLNIKGKILKYRVNLISENKNEVVTFSLKDKLDIYSHIQTESEINSISILFCNNVFCYKILPKSDYYCNPNLRLKNIDVKQVEDRVEIEFEIFKNSDISIDSLVLCANQFKNKVDFMNESNNKLIVKKTFKLNAFANHFYYFKIECSMFGGTKESIECIDIDYNIDKNAKFYLEKSNVNQIYALKRSEDV